jgi:hypothetical protein
MYFFSSNNNYVIQKYALSPEGMSANTRFSREQCWQTLLFVLRENVCKYLTQTIDHGRSASAGMNKGVKRPSLDNWLKSAGDALATFRHAETQREDGDIESADNSVLEGLCLLHERYYFHSTHSIHYTLPASVQELYRLSTSLGLSCLHGMKTRLRKHEL